MKKKAIIIGAGPAGLTAAWELICQTDIQPIIFESSEMVGGISRTEKFEHEGMYRLDIGGHRFFSKSEKVMDWWRQFLPLETENYSADKNDAVFLMRNRKSSILYRGKIFSYPLSLSLETLKNLGIKNLVLSGMSFLWAKIFPPKRDSLADFYRQRFGNFLYQTFFKSYTEKVWGIPCEKIPALWGAQRVKGLSLGKALWNAIEKHLFHSSKTTETSLIEQFFYPKFGPGQLWEIVAQKIQERGGEIHFSHEVQGFDFADSEKKLSGVRVLDIKNNLIKEVSGDFFFSSMPVSELVRGMPEKIVSPEVMKLSQGLPFRDFITVGVLASAVERPFSEQWIYIQEPDIRMGRIQIFNHWSPYMVSDPKKWWMGLEYFCQEGDDIWSMDDESLKSFALSELEKIKFVSKKSVLYSSVIRQKKAYPAYFGTYDQFEKVRSFLDTIENLYCIGRNGQHHYNNQDHSMLTAMEAVKLVREGKWERDSLWGINTEEEYHEQRTENK